jgi:glucosamine--fructose-6-phosphate aminotransferase (isomerizing)
LGSRADLGRVFFLGSGPQYGVANEAMLKMKEMSISHSEAYHFMEFRHGPKSMVDSQTLVVALLADAAYGHEAAVLDEMAGLGATTLALAPARREVQATQVMRLPADLPWWAYPVLYLPPLQLLAYHRAASKGLDPDNPRHLDAVVTLDVAALTGMH